MMALVYILVIIFLIALILAGLTFIVMIIDFIIRVTTEYDGIADAIHAKQGIPRKCSYGDYFCGHCGLQLLSTDVTCPYCHYRALSDTRSNHD